MGQLLPPSPSLSSSSPLFPPSPPHLLSSLPSPSLPSPPLSPLLSFLPLSLPHLLSSPPLPPSLPPLNSLYRQRAESGMILAHTFKTPLVKMTSSRSVPHGPSRAARWTSQLLPSTSPAVSARLFTYPH